MGYEGYQLSGEYTLGQVSKSLTPKGLSILKEVGLKLPYYISNYKGGRNESFMYGVDRENIWIDYDLISAYTTVMAGLGSPNYKQARKLDEGDLKRMSFQEILYSFIILKVQFKFSKSVKYPSISCTLDKGVNYHPLEGEAVITGAEYLLAMNQQCELKIKEIYYIPFDEGIYPFKEIIKDLQAERRRHPKDSLPNKLNKELGNSIYGLLVRGINDKRKYDIRLGETVRMEGNQLSNPILASWITAFIRSVIGECLHNIQ